MGGFNIQDASRSSSVSDVKCKEEDMVGGTIIAVLGGLIIGFIVGVFMDSKLLK